MVRLTHFKAGIFLLSGCAIIIAALLWIGAANLFRSGVTYVTFFRQPVDGLLRGAAVNHLGVEVGKVRSIRLTPDQKLVQVEMEIDPSFRVSSTMAAELKLKGVTGQQVVTLVKAPANIAEITPHIDFPTRHKVIPSTESQLARLEERLAEVSRKLAALDVGGVTAAWREAGEGVSRLVRDPALGETVANARKASESIRNAAAAVSGKETAAAIKDASRDLAAAAGSARRAGKHVEAELDRVPPGTVADLTRHLEETERRVDESAVLFRQTLAELNRLLEEMNGLVLSLREEPGKILNRPDGNEPFRR